MNRALAAAAGLIGAGLIGYAFLAAETDTEKIVARLNQLEDAVRVEEGANNPIVRAGRVNGEFAEIFIEDVGYRIPELTTAERGRKALARLATQAGTRVQSFDVDFTDVEVEVAESGREATVGAVARLNATRRGGRYERDERRVDLHFVDGDDGWQISEFRVSTAAD